MRCTLPSYRRALSPELQRALEPLLAAVEELSERILEYLVRARTGLVNTARGLA